MPCSTRMDEQGLHVVFANATEAHGFASGIFGPDRSFQNAGRSGRVRVLHRDPIGRLTGAVGRSRRFETIPSADSSGVAEHGRAVSVQVSSRAARRNAHRLRHRSWPASPAPRRPTPCRGGRSPRRHRTAHHRFVVASSSSRGPEVRVGEHGLGETTRVRRGSYPRHPA